METLEQIQKDIEEIKVTKNKLKNSVIPDSEKRKMIEDLDNIMEKLKEEEREGMFYGDWSHMRWRPSEGENIIRVLPAKVEREGSWFLRVNKHFVYTYSHMKPEVFICNFQLFNKSCALCEFERRREEKRDPSVRKFFGLTQQGVVNIVVRGTEREAAKVWEAPGTAFKNMTSINRLPVSILHKRKMYRDIKENALYECDLKVLYKPEEKPWLRYNVDIGKIRPMGTEEEKQQWLEQALELLPEVLYKPVEDSETSALLGEVKELMERVKREAYFKTPEGQAEMERGQQEEREKQEKEEKEKAEAKRRNEESRNKWREMIKDGSAAEEFKKESKKDVEGWSTWDILNELFIGEKDWDELAEILSQQLKEKAKAKK